MSGFKISLCTGTHIGDRAEQQDRVAIIPSKRVLGCALIIVCDGMGGKTGGAMAAQQVISTAQHLFDDWAGMGDSAHTLLENIANEAHTIIRLSGYSAEKEPHSTMVAMIISRERADWAHVGDSRLYHFDSGRFVQRTWDHSYVNQLVKEGKLTPEQARRHRLSNVLTSALGGEKQFEITFGGVHDLHAGESFVLCTDGVWAYFTDEELATTLDQLPPRQASEVLIQAARDRANGRGDNLTMAIVKLDPSEDTPAFSSYKPDLNKLLSGG